MAERRVEYVRLDEINTADRNPKIHDSAGIRRSIDHHGMGELPLLDERTDKLVAGHGRIAQLAAMHDDGQGAPDGVNVDDDGMFLVPLVRGWSSRSDADAEAYLIGSNRLSANGGVDEYMMTEILGELAGVNLLDLTGYDEGDFSAMEALYTPTDAELGGAYDDEDDDPDNGLGEGYGGGQSDHDQDTLDDTDRAAWPIIRAQVAPDLHSRFTSIDGETDAHRIRVLLDRAGVL